MAKMTDTEKLNLLIRDDPEISGKMYARMKMHINEATVVDAVEVVRCKDCGHYNPNGDYCGFWGECRHPEHFCGEGVTEDGK